MFERGEVVSYIIYATHLLPEKERGPFVKEHSGQRQLQP